MTKEERIKNFEKLFISLHGDAAIKYIHDEKLMAYLKDGGFFDAPASTKYHGCYDGGLYDHSKAVTIALEDITKNMDLKWQREESPFIIGMFHDLCKCDQYRKVEGTVVDLGETQLTSPAGFHYEYNTNTVLKGHGAKSVMILSQFITLTEEEMLCIRYHMGAYEKEEWTEFDMAIRKYENVLWCHTADQYASKVVGT